MGKLPISKEKTPKGKGGFTLVELSIVLVIIGLLIGGILAAQSMISTAKINATVRQIGQFDAGVISFKEKFNYLPGDAPAFDGDGDGLIEMTATIGYDNYINTYSCELVNFWSNMMPEKFIGKKCVSGGAASTAALISGPGKNVPEASIGSPGAFFIASALAANASTYLADSANGKNYYAILNGTQLKVDTPVAGWYAMVPTTSSNSAVKPIDLVALDTKMDDGVADTGLVLSGNIGNGGNGTGGIYTSPLAACSSGAAYNLANSGYECTPLIRIGAQTGDPQ